MARNRMINPEYWLDEELAKLSAHARLLYIGIWAICDDNYATLPNRPEWIKAQIFPYENINIPKLLKELVDSDKLIIFTANDQKEYFYIKNFFKYQRVEKPSKPKYPEYSDSTTLIVGEELGNTPAEEKRSKDKIKEEKREIISANAETPSFIFKSFIENPTEIISFLEEKGFPKEIVEREIKKFISYWTEPNKSGTKQRWELEKTFELKRRLSTWFSNVQKFSKNNQDKKNIII